jgi:hypothetical protein
MGRKLKPETIAAVAVTYARILERKHPGSAWTVRPIGPNEEPATTTLWVNRGKVASVEHR